MAKSKETPESSPDETEVKPVKITAMSLLNTEVEDDAFLTNCPLGSVELMTVVFAAERPSDIRTEEMLGQEFDVKYWVCKKTTIPGRQDEGPKRVVRTTIIDPQGRSYSSTSRGVVKSIDILRQFAADVPFIPPIRMRLQGTDIGKGADFLMLVPAHLIATTPKDS